MDQQALTMTLYTLMIFLLMVTIPVAIILSIITYFVRKVKRGFREIMK